MKGGNSDSKSPEIQGFDYENVGQYGSVDLKGGKGKKGKKSTDRRKSSSKFMDFDFEKEWKEFETSYNQKYGGKAKAKKAKKATSAKKPKRKQRGGDEMGGDSLGAFEEQQDDLTQTGGKAKAKAKAKAKKSAPKRKAPKRKTQRGGDESGATFAPAQMFDEKATMSAPPAGPFQSAYGTINAVDGLQKNLAPYPNSTETQTGGKKKGSNAKKTKTATKTAKPKKDSKKTKPVTKATGKKESVLDKIKKFFAM